MNQSNSHHTVRISLLAAALLSALMVLPASAAYPPCGQICGYSGPSTNCTCIHEQFGVQIHTTCGEVHTACSCTPLGLSGPTESSSALDLSAIPLLELASQPLTPAVEPEAQEQITRPQQLETEEIEHPVAGD